MDDPDLAWTVAAYLANGGTVPRGDGREGVAMSDHLGNAFTVRGGEVSVSRGRAPSMPYAVGRDRATPIVRALMDAVDDVSFTVRRARLPHPMGDVDLIEPDEPGLPMVAVGERAWLLEGDGTHAVDDDGDLAAAVACEYALSVGGRRRSFGM